MGTDIYSRKGLAESRLPNEIRMRRPLPASTAVGRDVVHRHMKAKTLIKNRNKSFSKELTAIDGLAACSLEITLIHLHLLSPSTSSVPLENPDEYKHLIPQS